MSSACTCHIDVKSCWWCENQKKKPQILNDLYEVLRNTENEVTYEIIGNAIDFIKRT
jgi:hypothetical protein